MTNPAGIIDASRVLQDLQAIEEQSPQERSDAVRGFLVRSFSR